MWHECDRNPASKKFKENDDKTRKEGGASAATLNLDGIPSDLLLQLSRAGVLQRGNASTTTGVTTTVLIPNSDALAADGEHGLGGGSAYS